MIEKKISTVMSILFNMHSRPVDILEEITWPWNIKFLTTAYRKVLDKLTNYSLRHGCSNSVGDNNIFHSFLCQIWSEKSWKINKTRHTLCHCQKQS